MKTENLHVWFVMRIPKLFFSPLCLGYVYFVRTLAKMARTPCHWFGSNHAVNIFWVKCLNPYALNVFMCLNNRGVVHQRNVELFMFVSVKFSQYVNISHRVVQRSIIKIQVTNFLTLGQEKTRKASTRKDSTDFIGILMHEMSGFYI